MLKSLRTTASTVLLILSAMFAGLFARSFHTVDYIDFNYRAFVSQNGRTFLYNPVLKDPGKGVTAGALTKDEENDWGLIWSDMPEYRQFRANTGISLMPLPNHLFVVVGFAVFALLMVQQYSWTKRPAARGS